ncbi:MAG: hypothetical protein LBC42_00425, partial [Puniceicoccales bacterium]|nr:hypothetical protein [Puniceicoccales bacterium]
RVMETGAEIYGCEFWILCLASQNEEIRKIGYDYVTKHLDLAATILQNPFDESQNPHLAIFTELVTYSGFKEVRDEAVKIFPWAQIQPFD